MDQTQIDAYRYCEKKAKQLAKLLQQVVKVNRSLVVAENSYLKRYEHAAGVYDRFNRKVCRADLVGTSRGDKWFEDHESKRLELLQKFTQVKIFFIVFRHKWVV